VSHLLNGMSALDSLFADMETRVQDADYTPVLDPFQQTLAEQHAGQFAGEFDSNLDSWAPLKPSTIKRKGHDRILYETGALRASLVTVGGPGNIHEVTPSTLLFGTSDQKALYHQEGTRKMPARPPVGVSEENIDKLVDQIADSTVEILMRG
jgi:phage gpG-like protein